MVSILSSLQTRISNTGEIITYSVWDNFGREILNSVSTCHTLEQTWHVYYHGISNHSYYRPRTVMTRVCPSFCLSTPRGGTRARSSRGGGGVPKPGSTGGYPTSGNPPCQTWPGGTLPGYPTLGTPQ